MQPVFDSPTLTMMDGMGGVESLANEGLQPAHSKIYTSTKWEKLKLHYFMGVLKALDQLANALMGGYADETISLHAARARNEGKRWGCVVCSLLERVVKDHCDKTLEWQKESLLQRGL